MLYVESITRQQNIMGSCMARKSKAISTTLYRKIGGLFSGLFLSAGLVLVTPAWAETNSVKLYFYHHQPPFLLLNDDHEKQAGLSQDVVQILNNNAAGQQSFTSVPMPRTRLNRVLHDWVVGKCPMVDDATCNDDWMLFWVTPRWLLGADQPNPFLTVDLYFESDVVISTYKHPISALTQEHLSGKNYAAIKGRTLPPAVLSLAKQGKINIVYGNNEMALFSQLSSGRAHATIMMRSTMRYIQDHPESFPISFDGINMSLKPYSEFMLQALIPSTRPDLKELLERLRHSHDWADTFHKYNLQPAN